MPTAMMVVGLGMSAVGTGVSMGAASSSAAANKDIAEAQMQQNALRQKQMELNAHRQQLETVRKTQVAHATALTAASAQGAILGSGLQGGYGQVAGDSTSNLLGINQNLQLGQANFGLDARISQDRMSLADSQAQAAFGQGLSSFGSSLGSVYGAANRLSGGFGASTNSGGLQYGVDYGHAPDSL